MECIQLGGAAEQRVSKQGESDRAKLNKITSVPNQSMLSRPPLRVQFILNVTREIDNFFPGLFEYHNIRVYDEEATDLLAYWNETYKFISRAK